VFRVFGFIPVIGDVIFFATAVWQLATMVVAVRQALDYRSTGRAIGVVIVGFLVYATLLVVLRELL